MPSQLEEVIKEYQEKKINVVELSLELDNVLRELFRKNNAVLVNKSRTIII